MAQQATCIELNYPNFNCKLLNSILVAEGPIQPTPLSTIYQVRITYAIYDKPQIEVLFPKLDSNEKKLPRVYEGDLLCLYYRKYEEWTKYDYSADKIVPWISLWLYYYEIWQITGKWLGGGIHPDNSKRNKSNKKKL